ncbi:MAG: SDR family oxidoreductase [Nitriliruptorales bacterium]|nr:SDR family oxidoreductase [Nitriliruptorales bacterium]
MGELDGRRVLVTGASSGIGESTARAVAGAGGAVALLARSEDKLAALADELGGVAVPADVTDVDATRRAVDDAADRLDGLDAIVNSAGVVRPAPVSEGDPSDWQLMFDVNVLGLLVATQAAIPHLRSAGGGNIVNVSSMSGRRLSSVPTTVYSGTKFAVHVISEGLRRELHEHNIRVTILAPGFVDTPIFDDLEDEETRERYRDAAQRVGLSAESVAEHVVHALAAPPDVTVYEVALYHTAQD